MHATDSMKSEPAQTKRVYKDTTLRIPATPLVQQIRFAHTLSTELLKARATWEDVY